MWAKREYQIFLLYIIPLHVICGGFIAIPIKNEFKIIIYCQKFSYNCEKRFVFHQLK